MNKKHVGFNLPHEYIRDEYAELLSMVKKHKRDWQKERDNTIKSIEEILSKAEGEMASKAPNIERLKFLHNAALGKLPNLLICILGIDLTDTNERISNIEKELKIIKRGLKL